jgi:hypothetical protein
LTVSSSDGVKRCAHRQEGYNFPTLSRLSGLPFEVTASKHLQKAEREEVTVQVFAEGCAARRAGVVGRQAAVVGVRLSD